MSGYVLLNLLYEFWKNEMRGSVEHFIFFPNEFNKFNNI